MEDIFGSETFIPESSAFITLFKKRVHGLPKRVFFQKKYSNILTGLISSYRKLLVSLSLWLFHLHAHTVIQEAHLDPH